MHVLNGGGRQWLLLTILFALGAGSARAQGTMEVFGYASRVGDVGVRTFRKSFDRTYYGYCDHVLELRNGSDEARTVDVILEASHRYAALRMIRRSVVLPPFERRVVSLMQPALYFDNASCRVRVEETGESELVGGVSLGSHGPDRWGRSTGLGGGGGTGGGDVMLAIRPLDPSDLGTFSFSTVDVWGQRLTDITRHWQALARFAGIAVSGSWLNSAAADDAQLLRDYVSAGGRLLVFGADALPADWHATGFKKSAEAEWQEMTLGFGSVLVFKKGVKDRFSSDEKRRVRQVVSKTGEPWRRSWSRVEAHRVFPVVGEISLPLRSTFLMMLVYALLCGPILIWFLGRRNRRIWLIWILPLVSVGTALVVATYGLLREGVTPSVRIDAITYLDQISKRATTLARTGYYCPVSAFGGLSFGREWGLTLMDEITYRDERSLSIDWTERQRLLGWISARIPEYFTMRGVATRNERIRFEHDEARDELSAVNGLGAPIKLLLVRDLNGHVYKAERVKAGAKVLLSREPDVAHERSLAPLLDHYERGWSGRACPAGDEIRGLKPGFYYAELEGAPFAENGLKQTCRESFVSRVWGLWKEAGDEG